MRFRLFAVLRVLAAVGLAAPGTGADAAQSDAGRAVVTARARAATAQGGRSDLLVTLPGYPDLSPARRLSGKAARTRFVFETLTRHTARQQARLLPALRQRGLSAVTLWISNQLWVRGASADDVRWLSQQPEAREIDIDAPVIFAAPQPEGAMLRRPLSARVIEPGVMQVRAPELWAQGITGTGVVVAGLDTGVQWDHDAIVRQYRGWNGVALSATHDYNWYDAAGWIANPLQPTGPVTPALTPFDDRGHGTHTISTVIGDDGAGNQIGVAPGARWIGCRNMLNNIGSVARYSACFQFALAPTDVNGNAPNPALAADITNNSWGCTPPSLEDGCGVPTALITATRAVRDAGIMVVASAGNTGSACGSIAAAPATLDQAFTVGAVDFSDRIAGFSSRGPSALTGRTKPDLVAPGVSVRGAYNDGGYQFLSGTSMAGPHAAGVAALLWSALPELRGEVSETEAILRRSAIPITTATEFCGGTPGTAIPNNTYGHGRIDAVAALSAALQLRPQAVITPAVLVSAATQPVVVYLSLRNAYAFRMLNDAVFTLTVPLSLTVVDAGGGVRSGSVMTWALGPIAPGEAATVTLTLRPDSPVMQELDLGPLQFAVDQRAASAGQVRVRVVPLPAMYLPVFIR